MASNKRPLDEKAVSVVSGSLAKRQKKAHNVFDPVGLFHHKQRKLLPRGSPAWDLWAWISAFPEGPIIVRTEGRGIWCCDFVGTVSEHEPVSVVPIPYPVTRLEASKVMHESERGADGSHPYLKFEIPAYEWDYLNYPTTNLFVVPLGASVGATLLGNPGPWGAIKTFGYDLNFNLEVSATGEARLVAYDQEEEKGGTEVFFQMEILREDQDWTNWHWEEDKPEVVLSTLDAATDHLPGVVLKLILEHCIVPSEAAKRAYEWVVRHGNQSKRRDHELE